MRFRFRRGQHPYFPLRRYAAPMLGSRSKKFVRDVILLDKCEPDVIPRGMKKMAMQEGGRVANMVEMDVLWDEGKVFSILEGRFDGIIDKTQPFPRYDRRHASFQNAQY